MITEEDLKRLYSTDKQEKLIKGAEKTSLNAQSDWARNYWYGVYKTLCKKWGRMDLFLKN